MRCIELDVCVCLPETGAVGSAGCSTDSCLNTAYLSEEEEDEDPDTGVSMAGTLYEADKTKSIQTDQSVFISYKGFKKSLQAKTLNSVLRFFFFFFCSLMLLNVD